MEVAGDRYVWRDGEDGVFDESFVHRAFNHTDQTRIILFCDVEQPMRFAWIATLNRVVARTLLSGGRAPNREGDPTGALGHAFGYFYRWRLRSEEHTSELQSLMRISYAVFCLKKKKIDQQIHYAQHH